MVEGLIAVFCAVSLAYFPLHWARFLGVSWDTSVYERAVADYHSGADPYRTDSLFPFVYHPLVLRALALLNAVAPLKMLFPALTLAALAWLSRELTKATARAESAVAQSSPWTIGPRQFLLAVVVGGAFGGIAAPALMSGNLTPLFDFALLAALVRGRFATGLFFRYLPYGLILLFSLVKPYILVCLAVPVMLYERRVAALACATVVVALFGVTWISFQWVWPDEYAHFLANLQWHILGRGDWGYTFFFIFNNLTLHNVPLALALHGVVAVVFLVLVEQFFKQRYAAGEVPFVPHLLVLYLVLTLANPRMKEYDLFPALVGLFTVLGALSRWANPLTLVALSLAAFPTLEAVVPAAFATNHPMLFDPFGSWQLLGLGVFAVALVVGVLETQQSQPAAEVRS